MAVSSFVEQDDTLRRAFEMQKSIHVINPTDSSEWATPTCGGYDVNFARIASYSAGV